MQQQPLEDRVAALEAYAQRSEQTTARMAEMIEHQDELMERLVANQEGLQANQETMFNLLEEVRRDAAVTRRLWLRLAQRYGWLDDEQNGDHPDSAI